MVSNHVVDLLKRYDQSLLPPSLTGYLERREFYDYSEHSRTGAKHGEFVDDETCDRFCILGTVDGSHREAPRARGARRQAVQHVPHDRCTGGALPRATASTSSPCSRTRRAWRSPVSRERAIADLRALAELTGGPGGARRLCLDGRVGERARGSLRERLDGAAGRGRASTRPATSGRASPGERPDDGRDRLAHRLGAERRLARRRARRDGARSRCCARSREAGTPPCTVTLVDWADEEGARFGRSLLGSSAAAGTLDPDDVRDLNDASGMRLVDALAENGVELDRALDGGQRGCETCAPTSSCTSSRGRCSSRWACPSATVLGTVGVERNRVIFPGQAAHAGSTPMPIGATRSSPPRASRSRCATRHVAPRRRVAPTGGATLAAGRRDGDRRRDGAAARPAAPRRRTCSRRCWPSRGRRRRGRRRPSSCTVEWEPIWRIEPIPFDPGADRGGAGARVGAVVGQRPRAAVGPAARRGRDGAPRADGDDVLLLDERHQPRQGGGHADRAPRARDPGLRADRRCGDRSPSSPARPARRSPAARPRP